MATAAETVRSLIGQVVTTPEGDDVRINLINLRDDHPQDVAAQVLGTRIPAELYDLLAIGPGIRAGSLELRWDGNMAGQETPGAFPLVWPVMEDGCGNCWNVEIDPESRALGPVHFACHDPPVVVHQADSLADFIRQFPKHVAESEDCALCAVAGTAAMSVFETGGLAQPASKVKRDDALLQHIAASCGPNDLIVDMRRARVGEGFSWGDAIEVVRPGPERVMILRY